MTRFRPFWRKTGPAERMIDWLAGKQPDDWFHVSGCTHDPQVLDWILSQPACDRATASKIFWTAWPMQFAQALAAGTEPAEPVWPVVKRVLREWRAGRWPRSEFAWAPDREQLRRYRMLVARQPGRADQLDIPPDLSRHNRAASHAHRPGPTWARAR